MTRMQNVSQEEVFKAWVLVKRAGGSAGHDNQTIADVQVDLDKQLYKIWNRMASGSYMAQPVKLVNIPKAGGGQRMLGIPTVTDRIAQMVIKNRLEAVLEEKFHPNSYGYRPNKSAIDAVRQAREQCFRYKWVIDLDIKGFFDNIDHDLMMKMVKEYTTDKEILLYTRRFLKAKSINAHGAIKERDIGTPQGGVVSPLLANLYLHEAFDMWMFQAYPHIKFERYADDIIVHCVSEKQAQYILDQIRQRLEQFKLSLHLEKTKTVYVGTNNNDPHHKNSTPRKFTFLGYEFKPRHMVYKQRQHMTFTPAIGTKALKVIRLKIDGWHWHRKTYAKLKDIAQDVNAIIRGWINYYGHFRRSALYKLAELIDRKLVKWLKRKHKSLKTVAQAREALTLVKSKCLKLFPHWYMIPTSKTQ